jgi:hypothetical protein
VFVVETRLERRPANRRTILLFRDRFVFSGLWAGDKRFVAEIVSDLLIFCDQLRVIRAVRQSLALEVEGGHGSQGSRLPVGSLARVVLVVIVRFHFPMSG